MVDVLTDKIAVLESMYPTLKVCWGGDGSLVRCWHCHDFLGKTIFPVRNYSQCEKHSKEIAEIFASPDILKTKLLSDEIKITEHQLVGCQYGQNWSYGLSEIQVVSADIVTALRFNVLVNGEKYLENVIATAAVCSSVFGSTGYWSSITRTIFRNGYGLAFIAPTVGINNLILDEHDTVMLEFVRDCSALIAADDVIKHVRFEVGDRLPFNLTNRTVKIAGLSQFHCNTCRAKRNGTVLSNQYLK